LSNTPRSKRRLSGVYVSKRRWNLKGSWWIALALLSWIGPALVGQAPDGTPERALQDLALATKAEEIERHLPVAIVERAKTLGAEDRMAYEANLVARPAMPEAQSKLEIPDDGHAFLVMKNSDMEQGAANLTDSVVTGSDAVLRFALGRVANEAIEVMVWMRFEDGEWRIRELDPGSFRSRIRFDEPEFVERFRNRELKANESAAVSTLASLHYSLQRFVEDRPDVGFPDDLSLLSPATGGDEDGDEPPAAYLSAELACNDAQSDGYRFHYQLLRGGPEGAYQITARPALFGKSGRFGYVINESGDIHVTGEKRDATTDDPMLGASEPDSASTE